jgi:polyhydroxyalkanoate synthesis regulator phasin
MEKTSTLLTDNMEGFEQEPVDWKKYETSFRRWLVSEIEMGTMTLQQAKERFQLPYRFDITFKKWQLKYSSKIHVALQSMTPEELTELKKLQERIRELERQLEDAQIKNVLTETMIDIAEEQLKIDIRKKSGPKQ